MVAGGATPQGHAALTWAEPEEVSVVIGATGQGMGCPGGRRPLDPAEPSVTGEDRLVAPAWQAI